MKLRGDGDMIKNGQGSFPIDPAYSQWLKALKTKFRSTQLKAVVRVNRTLLEFYWELGADIIEKQSNSNWGDGFLKQLSQDMTAEFPGMKGFSERNLKYMRQWFLFYAGSSEFGQQAVAQIAKPSFSKVPDSHFGQQAVGQITQIPWGHNITIITKCKIMAEAVFYVQNTKIHNWSRSVLMHQIESGLWHCEGKAITNFTESLPAPQSDLAQQTLKDPYVFDFLTLTKEHNERDLELGLTRHITNFLLELGAGFAYMGRQVALQVGERDFFIDLLFYHTKLNCYVVIELKTTDFEPEYVGKLNFYIKAVDEQFRNEDDQPTIGLLLCKNKDKLVAEYALSDIQKPMGISEYQLSHTLPDNLKSSLPSIEEIEAELCGKGGAYDEDSDTGGSI